MKRPVKQERAGQSQQELSLLGDAAQAIDPYALFDTWLSRQQPRFLPSTQNLYRTLWRRFLEDIQVRGKLFHAIQPVDIQEFLTRLDGVKRPQRERYQQLIERAYHELWIQDPSMANPASAASINDPWKAHWRQAPDNEATQFLTTYQVQALIKAMQHRLLILNNPAGYTQAAIWRQSRDVCIVGLLLGAGIRPQELTQLRRSQWQSLAPADTQRFTHEWPVLENSEHWSPGTTFLHIQGSAQRQLLLPNWVASLLRQWTEYAQLEPQALLFPGSRHISAARPAISMNPATLARVVSKWGMQHAQLLLTPQRLRNVYGACLLQAGLSLNELELLMGYAPGAASAWRLQAAWLQWSSVNDNSEADQTNTSVTPE